VLWQSVSSLTSSPFGLSRTKYAKRYWSSATISGRLRPLSEALLNRFVIQQNVEHYRALREITTDLEQRGMIDKLLLEEEAKLKKYDDDRKKK
jgi:hypothetical protein